MAIPPKKNIPLMPYGKLNIADLQPPEDFDRLLAAQGVRICITPVSICPNQDINLGNHNLNCPLCDNGVIEFPDQAEECWAYISGVQIEKLFQTQGVWDMGSAMMTTNSFVRMGFFYKVVILDFSRIHQQLIVRSATGTTDKIMYEPVPDCKIPYLCADKTGKRYTSGVHFIYETDKKIRWTGATKPANGVVYTLSYPARPVYRVLDVVHENRFHFVAWKKTSRSPIDLPQQALIKLDYLTRKK